jgi:hypothetical protein
MSNKKLTREDRDRIAESLLTLAYFEFKRIVGLEPGEALSLYSETTLKIWARRKNLTKKE